MKDYSVGDKALQAMGQEATARVIAEVAENFRKRLGNALGGEASGCTQHRPQQSMKGGK